ncbi:MAG: metallophosphoesterase [Sorangiineae bacterium]|nr:metallophosphoesterase [Polyangiaceae bacterium]MEB2322096.1 metallophosphoesterase [Sorangiineae bacterium]
MNRSASMLLFFAVGLAIVGSVHYYLWARLVRDVGLSPWGRKAGTLLVAVLFASVPATLILARRIHPGHARWLFLALFAWMGVVFFLLVTLAAGDLVKIVARFAGALGRPPDPSRRLALSRVVGAAAALVTGGATARALATGLGAVMIRRLTVKLARLPGALDGITIAHLTDIHVGPTIGRDFLAGIVHQTNQLAPDLVAITGDLVDGTVEALRDQLAPLTALRARHGVFFVTGNHEYFYDADAWCDELERIGLQVLRNRRVSISNGAESFDLAGVDDHQGRPSPRHGGRVGAEDVPGALAGRDPARECVLLAHQPRTVLEALKHGVGLQLSGHTHGGQLWPWRYLVYLQQPIVSGLGRFGDTQVWVSNGTGYWGPPMRLGAPPEITLITLTRG